MIMLNHDLSATVPAAERPRASKLYGKNENITKETSGTCSMWL